MKAITTSSEVAVQGLLDIVHLKVYVVPAAPLKLDVALDEVVIVPPAPLMMLHAPVPIDAALPARVTLVKPQVAVPVWSAPAVAAVGFWLNLTTTSSYKTQEPFAIVQRKVYVDPAVPLKVEVSLLGEVIVPPVPLTMLQVPVPIEAALPDRFTVVNSQVEASV